MLKLPITRPVTTLMIFFGLALLGVISWTRLPQELFPSLEFPQITIVTKYEGAGPEESEKLISKIIEETVGTVKKVAKVTSLSKEGVSVVTCEFDWGTNMDFAAMEVREKIDLIKEALPREANEPIVLKYNPFQMEAMILSVSYIHENPGAWELAEMRYYCKKHLKDELERLDGVAKVEIRGGEKKEILVETDKGRLVANQISIMDVIKSLKEANITYPAGTVKEELYEYLVKTVGEFKNVDDIKYLSFVKEDQEYEMPKTTKRLKGKTPKRRRKIVYIKDIADVREELKDRSGYSRYSGKDNVSLGIYPQSGSNLINISKAIRKKLKEIEFKFPSTMTVQVIYDQSEFIKTSLNNIYMSALQGGALSFVILFIFLKSIAASVIICLAIPLSILVTLSLMYFGNISINTMSLGGLAIGVGMVVDNANIVLENIFAYAQKNPGAEKKKILYESTKEVVAPIVSGTVTTIAIFLPFIFVTGMAGQLFKELALTITFSLIASIFVAIFLVPRLALNVNLSKFKSYQQGSIQKAFSKMLSKVLKWSMAKVIFLIFLYVAIGATIFVFLPKEFMPKIDERRFTLNISMHPETPLDNTDKITQRVEYLLSQIPEVKDISVQVGSTGEEGSAGAVESLGQYQSRILAKLTKKGRSTNKVVAELSDKIREWNVENLETEFITQQGLFGSSLGTAAGITIEIKGKDLTQLRNKAEQFRDALKEIPDVYGIKINPSDLVPELKVVVDRERASLFGLSTQDISAMTLAGIKGYIATKLKLRDEEYDIRVRMRPEDRADFDKIGEMTAYSPWGMTIQLKQISQLNFVKSLPAIRRIEGRRTYLLTANIKKDFNKTVKVIEQKLNSLPKSPSDENITWDITGEMLAMQESVQSSFFALILGIMVIYMILASQFESLSQPLIVMITVPLGLVGAFYTLLFTFQSINSISMLGLIMLTGVAVNAAIILVDRYNLDISRKPGANKEHIVLEASVDHLRPILMTSLTTIIGLMPLALGLGEGSESTSPMAITMVGGLGFALVLTVFFVPRVYLQTVKNKKANEKTEMPMIQAPTEEA